MVRSKALWIHSADLSRVLLLGLALCWKVERRQMGCCLQVDFNKVTASHFHLLPQG
jgi:hypothetical protein